MAPGASGLAGGFLPSEGRVLKKVRDLDFHRSSSHLPQVVLIDGLWGSGKSLVAPFVSSLKGSSPYRIDSTTEVLTVMLAQGKISEDAYKFFVLNTFVKNYYDVAIGREINLRPGDDSSFFRMLGSIEIARRLLSQGSDELFERDLREGRLYVQMTHLLSFELPRLFEVLPDAFKIMTIRRNPAFMVGHWRNYLKKFDRPRELTLATRFGGEKVPFFAMSWPEEWCKGSITDRALLSLARCSVAEEENLDSVGRQSDNSATLFFSDFIARPEENLRNLEIFLGRPSSIRSRRLARGLTKARARSRPARRQPLRPENSAGADLQILTELRSETSSPVFKEFEESVLRFREIEKLHQQ